MLNKFRLTNIACSLFFGCVEGEMLLYFTHYAMVLYSTPPLSHCFVHLSFPLTHVWLSEIERKTYGSLLTYFCCQLQRNNVVLAPQLKKHTCGNPLMIHYLYSLANLSLIIVVIVVVNKSLHLHSQLSFYFLKVSVCVQKIHWTTLPFLIHPNITPVAWIQFFPEPLSLTMSTHG